MRLSVRPVAVGQRQVQGPDLPLGMGLLVVFCNIRHDQLWQATFYQLPHDINHRQPGPW